MNKSFKKNLIKKQIQVVCRVRPFLNNELKSNAVTVDIENKMILMDSTRISEDFNGFKFDNVYTSDMTQEDIFKKDALPLVQQVIQGFDATIFCYGMTGAGKTHTLVGTLESPGLIPKSLSYIFEEQNKFLKHNGGIFDITMSYMEIYKEIVYDLLVEREKQSLGGLSIRETPQKEIFVMDLSHIKLESMDSFYEQFNKAVKNRSTASTKLNSHSSRSHAILNIEVTIKSANSNTKTISKLCMIDLAGSEDNRRTNNNTIRMAESGAINKSLFVLGQVVDAINSGASRIPYRDSKMTRILQPSLSGKCLGLMIVNIAPGKEYYFETYQALKFAIKSKEIVSIVKPKEILIKPEPDSLSIKRPFEKINKLGNNLSHVDKRKMVEILDSSKLKNFKLNSCNNISFTFNSLKINKSNSPVNSIQTLSDAKEIIKSRAKLDSAVELVNIAQELRLNGKLTDALKYYVQANEVAPEDPIILKRIDELCTEIKQLTTPPKGNKTDQVSEFSSEGTKNFKLESVQSISNIKTDVLSKSIHKNFMLSKAEPICTTKNKIGINQNLFNKQVKNSSKDINLKEKSKNINEIDNLNISSNSFDTSATLSEIKKEPTIDIKKEQNSYEWQSKLENLNIDKMNISSNLYKHKKIPCELSSNFFKYQIHLNDSNHPLLLLLNTGNLRMIKSLHGVGPKRAKMILEVRQKAPFNTLKELLKAGFTEKMILKLIKGFYDD